MNGAEMRAQLRFLGFTLDSFARFAKRDLRALKRYQNGNAPVARPVEQQIKELEQLATSQLADWDKAAEQGVPIEIPRLNETPSFGEFPSHWYLALAGRHIAKWGEDATVEWAGEWESKDVQEI